MPHVYIPVLDFSAHSREGVSLGASSPLRPDALSIDDQVPGAVPVFRNDASYHHQLR